MLKGVIHSSSSSSFFKASKLAFSRKLVTFLRLPKQHSSPAYGVHGWHLSRMGGVPPKAMEKQKVPPTNKFWPGPGDVGFGSRGPRRFPWTMSGARERRQSSGLCDRYRGTGRVRMQGDHRGTWTLRVTGLGLRFPGAQPALPALAHPRPERNELAIPRHVRIPWGKARCPQLAVHHSWTLWVAGKGREQSSGSAGGGGEVVRRRGAGPVKAGQRCPQDHAPSRPRRGDGQAFGPLMALLRP
jgi:hypothetical protein